MATVQDALEASLKEIVVGAAEAPVSSSDAADYIFSLNNWMNAVSVKLSLTWTAVSTVGDTLELKDADATDVTAKALDAIVSNMAVRIAPQYGATPDMELTKRAKEGLDILAELGMTTISMSMPSRLPKGSGNTDNSLYTDQFYPGSST